LQTMRSVISMIVWFLTAVVLRVVPTLTYLSVFVAVICVSYEPPG
jgi:hypothetical protein